MRHAHLLDQYAGAFLTVLQQLQDKGYAYELDHVVDDAHTCVRFCTSWATPVEAVDQLLKDLAACK